MAIARYQAAVGAAVPADDARRLACRDPALPRPFDV